MTQAEALALLEAHMLGVATYLELCRIHGWSP